MQLALIPFFYSYGSIDTRKLAFDIGVCLSGSAIFVCKDHGSPLPLLAMLIQLLMLTLHLSSNNPRSDPLQTLRKINIQDAHQLHPFSF